MKSTGKYLSPARCVVFFATFCQGATINSKVKGPDGGPFQSPFIQTQNKNTKITYIVLSSLDRPYRVQNLTKNSSCTQL